MTKANPDVVEAAAIAEAVSEGYGYWMPCSGCQESDEGYVSTELYPVSAKFSCQPGMGCGECGGIGVTWMQTGPNFFEEMQALADFKPCKMCDGSGEEQANAAALFTPKVQTEEVDIPALVDAVCRSATNYNVRPSDLVRGVAEDTARRMNGLFLNAGLSPALQSEPDELLRTAEVMAIAKAQEDGADSEMITTHRTAYSYLREALARLEGKSGS